MNLKKLTSLVLISGAATLAACGGSVTDVIQFSPNDFKPPMGLSAIAGNEAVTLTWQAANKSTDDAMGPADSIELGGFAVYMFEGDLMSEANASEPVPMYTDEEAFPGIAGRDQQGFGPSPDAFVVINGTDAATTMGTGTGVSAVDATVPGVVVFQLANGAERPLFDATEDCLVGVEGCGAEGTTAADDTTADDTSGDSTASDAGAFSPAQTAPADGTDTVAGDSGGTIALANGTIYTFTVAARDVEFLGQSFASNLAATAPRGEITGVTLTANVAATNGLDIAAGAASEFGAHDGDYVETDGTGEVDVVIESVGTATSGFYTPGAANYFAGCNGSSIQDVGFVDSWDEVGVAPGGGYLGGGRSVLVIAGHLYVVSLADGTFAKVLVTASDATAQTVSVDIAHQTGATTYFK